jgi:hypothetical protein
MLSRAHVFLKLTAKHYFQKRIQPLYQQSDLLQKGRNNPAFMYVVEAASFPTLLEFKGFAA